MNRTLFVLGPSDIEAQNAVMRVPAGKNHQKVGVQLAGVLPILHFVMSDRTLKANSKSIVLGVHQVNIPPKAPINLFNLVGDADSSHNMLRNIQAIEARVQPLRCFNRPVDVFKTSRERLPKTLANIPGCVVPRVESVNPTNFSELEAVCTSFGRWPMILRAPGYHGGDHMQLVATAAELETLREEAWAYEGIHLIEFVDFRGEDGLYQKIRVMMVDGVPYPRQSIFSDRWVIHGGSRADLMAEDEQLRLREEQFLAYLRDTGISRYAEVFREIYRRIGLDIFGIDFALVDDQIVIFEASACMNFLVESRADNHRYRYLESYTSVLKRAVKKLLVQA